jgi:hypothetical protein
MWVGYLITSEDRLDSGDFTKLLASLPQSGVRLVVGCRGFDHSRLPPEVKDKLDLPLATSLSDARNMLLETFPYGAGDLVFFPDDDCWLPAGALDIARQWLQTSDFLIGVVDVEGGESASIGHVYSIQEQVALKKAASAAIFVRVSCFGSSSLKFKLLSNITAIYTPAILCDALSSSFFV